MTRNSNSCLISSSLYLAHLMLFGVLQKNNSVDLKDLVNTAVEMIEGEELSEKEICRAIFQ